MSRYHELKEKMVLKLKKKFIKAGFKGKWADKAARRVIEMYENGKDLQEAVYEVYREM